MALVTQRIWRAGPRKVKRAAWGYTTQLHGKQVRCFREEWTKEDAEKALAARLLGVTVETPTIATGPTIGQVMERFLEARRKSKHNKSVGDDEERSRPVLTFFGKDTPASAITTARVGDYRLHRMGVKSRQGRPLSTTTINRECQVLRGALRLALEREEIAKIPKFRMEDEASRERWLDDTELTALVVACHESKTTALAPMVVLAVHTGMRLSEVTGLQWKEVDLTRGVISLDASRTKSGKSRVVPLNRDAYDVLIPLRSDAGGLEAKGEVFGGVHDIDTAFRCAVKRAGLDTNDRSRRVTFHTLRHSFASLYAQRTGDLLRLQKILGHSSYRTTEKVYAKFTPDYVVGSTAALEGVGSRKPTPINAPSTHEPVAVAARVEGVA